MTLLAELANKLSEGSLGGGKEAASRQRRAHGHMLVAEQKHGKGGLAQ